MDALASGGEGAVALIEGPAGIGKSALLATAVELAGERGARVLSARGTELELDLAFGGVRQLFGAAVRRLADVEQERVLAGPAGLARRVLGLDAAPLSATGLSDPLYGLFWLAANLAELKPLVLAVDDVHWLDEESGRYVAYLAARLEGLPLLLLVGARPNEPGTAGALGAAIAEYGSVLRPRPLSSAAVAQLIAGYDARAAYEATGGNPLLVHELARSLAAGRPGADLHEIGSATVARSVLARVALVSDAATALASAVALFPDGASLADAAAVAGLDEDTAGDAADGLAHAEVFAGGDRLRFLHPLMRAAVYEQLGAHSRRRGHARAVAAMRARGAADEELVPHLLISDPAGDPETVRIMRAAADAAVAATAPRAAARYLERALAEPPAAEERGEMRHLLGRLQAMTGREEAEDTLRTAAKEVSTQQQRADVVIDLAATAYANEHHEAAIADLVALQAGTEVDAERRLVLDTLLAELAFSSASHASLYREAIRRLPADMPGDTPAQRLALGWVAMERFNRCEPAASVVEIAMRSIGDEGPYEFPVGTDIADPVGLLVACGELDVAQALSEARLARARETGAEATYATVQQTMGWIEFLRGDLRAAEAALRLGLDSPALQPTDRAGLTALLVSTCTIQGRGDDAGALAATVDTGSLGSMSALWAGLSRAELALLRGDFQAAIGPYERMNAYLQQLGVTNPHWLLFVQDYADALAGVGRRPEAIAIMRDYLESALRFGEALPIGTAHISLGKLLDRDAGAEHIEQAHAILAPSPYRWNAARAELGLGILLRRRNQPTKARERLRSVLDYAVRQGVRPLAARAEEELRLTGARPRRRLLTGVASLTPSEDRIARLAADGMTNNEIAQHLFLTPKTIETHLGGVYRKLDIRSRRQLPGALAAGSM